MRNLFEIVSNGSWEHGRGRSFSSLSDARRFETELLWEVVRQYSKRKKEPRTGVEFAGPDHQHSSSHIPILLVGQEMYPIRSQQFYFVLHKGDVDTAPIKIQFVSMHMTTTDDNMSFPVDPSAFDGRIRNKDIEIFDYLPVIIFFQALALTVTPGRRRI